MRHNDKKFHSGFTLIELMIAVLISSILALTAGVLIVSGTRSWQQTYKSAHRQSDEDALVVTMAIGNIGRKSNRLNYLIYNVAGSTFTPAVPLTANPEEVVSGNAVEFRYWDVDLDTSDTHDLMDVEKPATAYALFYFDGSQLKVDYGPYPPGAVPANGTRNTSNISTVTLASNVSADPNIKIFSHTTLNGVGEGCVRINAILTDPADGSQNKVMTSVLMRNMWPR